METRGMTSTDIKEALLALLIAWQPARWWQRLLKRWLIKELD